MRSGTFVAACGVAGVLWSGSAFAQGAGVGAGSHSEMQMSEPAEGWRLMQDGVVYLLFNQQGSPRGGREFVAPNWWMGMLTREKGRHQFGANVMLSLDPATVGRRGYREIFQIGEALDGRPLIDRQHPHDLFMQLAASWRTTFVSGATLTVAGGPVGEPTLGPVAFMHRASASGLPLAPLGHHTFDSTHISYGVATASLGLGKWTAEGSVFNGREPDERRWNIDVGRMDSFAGRVWFRPTSTIELQASTGRLRDPEMLAPGDVHRTTVSAAWYVPHGEGFTAATVAYGMNAEHGERRHGMFGEITVQRAANSISARAEFQQVETNLLLTDEIPDGPHAGQPPRTIAAVTVGGARRVVTWRGYEGALAAEAVFYGVPDVLRPAYGAHPMSLQVFFRLRLPAGMGRMTNMRMSDGPAMHAMSSGHVMR